MPLLRSGGLNIAYDDTGGHGPALLCLHGWCDSRAAFDAVTPLLGAKHRVIRLDWRGHGQSDPARGDFTANDLVADALAVIEATGAAQVIPVAAAHAGWIAIELRRRLGSARVPKCVFIDWFVLEPPPPFLAALEALQDPSSWQPTRDRLFAMWVGDGANPPVRQHVYDTMGRYDAAMWARAGREIARAYAENVSPLAALASLAQPSLHIYAQPADPGCFSAQRAFAAANPWFNVAKLEGQTHFPTIELPNEVSAAVHTFL